jgi:hypothetical protein
MTRGLVLQLEVELGRSAPVVSGDGRRSEQSRSGVPEEDEAGRCQGD